MACDATPSPARFARLAPREQLVEHARQDRGLAAERAARRLDQVVAGARGVATYDERIDVERADDARIQALEVEHPDVAMQAGDAARARGRLVAPRDARVVERTLGATMLQPLQLAQIQEVERRDARSDAIRRHAGELAARERERHEVELLDDLVREPRVGARVQRERGQVVRGSCAGSRRCGRARRPRRLCLRRAPRARRRRASSRPCARTRRAAGRCRRARAGPGSKPGRCRNSLRPCAAAAALESRPSSSGWRSARRDPLQHREVEVDRVPARQHVADRTSRTRAQNASSAAYSFDAARRALRHRPRTAGRRSALRRGRGAYSEIASRRSPSESVSMSNDSTRGSTVTSAGRSIGLSKIHVTPLPAVASPSISQPPLMPRSIR